MVNDLPICCVIAARLTKKETRAISALCWRCGSEGGKEEGKEGGLTFTRKQRTDISQSIKGIMTESP
jgi:hypothetical protein